MSFFQLSPTTNPAPLTGSLHSGIVCEVRPSKLLNLTGLAIRHKDVECDNRQCISILVRNRHNYVNFVRITASLYTYCRFHLKTDVAVAILDVSTGKSWFCLDLSNQNEFPNYFVQILFNSQIIKRNTLVKKTVIAPNMERK